MWGGRPVWQGVRPEKMAFFPNVDKTKSLFEWTEAINFPVWFIKDNKSGGHLQQRRRKAIDDLLASRQISCGARPLKRIGLFWLSLNEDFNNSCLSDRSLLPQADLAWSPEQTQPWEKARKQAHLQHSNWHSEPITLWGSNCCGGSNALLLDILKPATFSFKVIISLSCSFCPITHYLFT